MYKVKDLAQLDRAKARKIKVRVETDLAKNPLKLGKPLTGNLKGKWWFRFSEYRVIYEIKPNELLIIVVEVGHRKEIYSK